LITLGSRPNFKMLVFLFDSLHYFLDQLRCRFLYWDGSPLADDSPITIGLESQLETRCGDYGSEPRSPGGGVFHCRESEAELFGNSHQVGERVGLHFCITWSRCPFTVTDDSDKECDESEN
jgi:hypothetical protein